VIGARAAQAGHGEADNGEALSAYATAGNAYTETTVLTASSGQLVVMMYDGAIRFLTQASSAMREGSCERSRDRLRRAEAIIDELNVTLDMERGGEIAQRLRAIYLFSKRELRDANLRADPKRIEVIVRLLGELRDSWSRIAARTDARR
jgi:flagellar protein FliS